MTSQINSFSSSLLVTEVEDVVVTEKVQDNGVHVRQIRIFGTPGGINAPPVLTVEIRSDTSSKISITDPGGEF